MEKTIEIPFGAKDSELKGWEYTIPEGMEAEIKDGKIILKENDERIRSFLYDFIKICDWSEKQYPPREKCLAYLEKLKAEIEKRARICRELSEREQDENPDMGNYYRGKAVSLEEILLHITSLQLEQESVAERFARIVRGNLIGIDKEVQQKFEQLYFEVTGNKMYGGYND